MEVGASVGEVITASYNPSQRNGYKGYGSEDCHITTEVAAAVLAYIAAVDELGGVEAVDLEDYLVDGLIRYRIASLLDAFLVEVRD